MIWLIYIIVKKDKKNRFYIVSALADTKVDLKGMLNFVNLCSFFNFPVFVVSHINEINLLLRSWAVLSQRLGLGKGGLRMAPEEALGELLQVCLCLRFISFCVLTIFRMRKLSYWISKYGRSDIYVLASY
jgi:hypothetical protein